MSDGWAWEPSYWITPEDAELHGYQVPTAPTLPDRTGTVDTVNGSADQAARQAIGAVEAERAERRRVKALNAAGLAETTLRREHLTALFGAQDRPEGQRRMSRRDPCGVAGLAYRRQGRGGAARGGCPVRTRSPESVT